MEKIVEYEGKEYLVTLEHKEYYGPSHSEWIYTLHERQPVKRWRLFRKPVTEMRWVMVDFDWESNKPKDLEEFMREARILIRGYHEMIRIEQEHLTRQNKFEQEFAAWDGKLG